MLVLILCSRLVVQGAPPFLVVYANAAYATLTGIECHTVIGKPISVLVSIPDPTSGGGEALSTRDSSLLHIQDTSRPEGSSQDNDTQGRATAEEAGRGMDVDMNLEHLVATCGSGKYHMINVATKPKILGRNITVVHQDTRPTSMENHKTGASCSSRGDQYSHSSMIPSMGGHMVFATCRMGVSPVVSSHNAMDYAVVTDAVATDKDQEVSHHRHHHGESTTGKHHSLKRGDGGASTILTSSSKRRKHHHHDEQLLSSRAHHRSMLMMKDANRRITQQSTISHFVIQLELADAGTASREQHSAGSLSSATTSTKVEARLYGLTKAEVKRRRLAMNGDAAVGEEVVAPRDVNEPPPRPPQQDAPQDESDAESVDSDPKEPVAAIG